MGKWAEGKVRRVPEQKGPDYPSLAITYVHFFFFGHSFSLVILVTGRSCPSNGRCCSCTP